jgi:hypothetical protein
MFVDDDVALGPRCIARLVAGLRRRPLFAALAADYLGEHRRGEVAPHVAMGATLFRREALQSIEFRWEARRCECQCCCDDLRRLHWGIGYTAAVKARHLSKGVDRAAAAESAHVGAGDERSPAETRSAATPWRLPSVCLVICYFGRPPGWINRYLISCAYNPSINFLIFTDQADFPATPSNVRVERLDVEKFNALASQKLGFNIQLRRPYKLCDFKPAYGLLFEEYLKGFDYWGYADIDVIYGDVRRFLTLAKLEQFDVYTARKEFIAGHFSLFRNDDRMRLLFRDSVDYRSTLLNPEMLSFSECGKQWRRRMRGLPLTRNATCDSMMHVITRHVEAGRMKVCYLPAALEWLDLGPDAAWRLRWHAGRLWLLDQQREVMYFHFNVFRHRLGYKQPKKFEFEAAFDISPQGFEPVR